MTERSFRNTVAALAAVLVLALLAGCAHVGAGNPLTVKTEDVLSNSLAVYEGLMSYHFANSTQESNATYNAIEAIRVKFPTAWQAVYDARTLYKADATGSADQLTVALEVLRGLVHQAVALTGAR